MTEGDAGPDRGQRARLIGGRISCLVGLLLGIGQIYYALLSGDANTSAGILGIAFCVLGYYLNSRKLATATVFLCVAAILFSLATSQGLISKSASQQVSKVSHTLQAEMLKC
jgi:hypothetical protein